MRPDSEPKADSDAGIVDQPRVRALQSLDDLFKKYASVWLWSIIFAASVGVGGILIGTLRLEFTRWGPLTPVVMIVVAISIVAMASTWIQLYLYLSRGLLPLVFKDSGIPSLAAGKHLLRAAASLFFAVIIILLLIFIMLSFEALR